MNDLREKIADELDTFRTVANSRSRGGDDPMDVAWEFVPRILALIAEAMLSDEAVGSIVASHKGFIWSWQEYDGDPDSLGWNDDSWAKEYVRDLCTAAGITGAELPDNHYVMAEQPPTRMDAIRNAVAQATATQEGASDDEL